MKKALAIIMAFAMVTGVAFAQTATYGVDANFEAQVMKDAHSDTWEQGTKASQPTDVFNPEGFKMTAYNVAPWINLDWSKASIKAAASYNAIDNNLSDFSSMTLTSTWKDFFGLEIKSVATANNKVGKIGDDSTVTAAAVKYESVKFDNTLNGDHKVWITYDKTAENGIKLYTKYDSGEFFALGDVAGFGLAAENILDGFDEIGFALDNTELAANVVFKQDYTTNSIIKNAVANRFTTAWFEAKNLFGVWTARFNDDSEMKLRITYPDTDVTIDRSNFGIGKYNNVLGGYLKNDDLDGAAVQSDGKTAVTAASLLTGNPLKGVQWRTDLNMMNTIKPMENLTVKTALVIPTTSTRAIDWLKGNNFSVGADYMLDGVGTIGAGAKLSMDYVACDFGGNIQGPSKRLVALSESDTFFNAYAASPGIAGGSPTQAQIDTAKFNGTGALITQLATIKATGTSADTTLMAAIKAVNWDSSYWLDADLGKLVGEKNTLFVTGAYTPGNYVDFKATLKDWQSVTPLTNIFEFTMASLGKIELGAEGSMAVSDALKVSAAGMYKMGFGYDREAATGTKASDVIKAAKAVATNFVTDSYTEENINNSGAYDITPIEANVRADYKLNKTVALWVQNGFVANDTVLDDDATVTSNVDSANIATAKRALGFVSANSIELGAKLAATEKSTLTVSTEYNMYLGVPEASDLYASGATDAQKKALDAAYGSWVSTNFNPISVSVAYSYAY